MGSKTINKNDKNTSKFSFVDMFAGIGGFHQALKELGGECVAACEIDENARKTYLSNHKIKENLFYKDINKLEAKDIPNHDILCAGFPCQPFSISGKQKALKDERSNVIDSLFKILKTKKPKIIILENVKHIKHIEKGEVFEFIVESLKDIGYSVSYQLLNAKNFGVAQNRERWIFVGVLGGSTFEFREPKRKSNVLKNILDTHQNDFHFLEEPYTVIDKPKKQKSGLIFCGYRNKSIRKVGVREGTNHLSRVHKQPNRIYSINGVHPTIPSQESSGRFWIMLEDGRVRKMTVNECFRIMGFPEKFKKPVPTGNLYKQIGNSVCVPMVKDVATWILDDFSEVIFQ